MQLKQEDYITDKCVCCELCRLCNGCRTHREIAKEDPNFCEEMKKLEDDLIRTEWLL
jgi:sulfatase maturation enzyme AslB (radical SAM superfamily)